MEDKPKKLDLDTQKMVADIIKEIWQLLWFLRPYKEHLKYLAKDEAERARTAVGLAVLNPMGWDVANKKHEMRAKRARLLVEMLDTLENTQNAYNEALKEKESREKIAKIFE